MLNLPVDTGKQDDANPIADVSESGDTDLNTDASGYYGFNGFNGFRSPFYQYYGRPYFQYNQQYQQQYGYGNRYNQFNPYYSPYAQYRRYNYYPRYYNPYRRLYSSIYYWNKLFTIAIDVFVHNHTEIKLKWIVKKFQNMFY